MTDDGGATESVPPPLTLLHEIATIVANPSYKFWQKQTTDDIVMSLRVEGRRPLTVKADGTVVDGNTRILVLQQRGYAIDALPRVIYEPWTMETNDG